MMIKLIERFIGMVRNEINRPSASDELCLEQTRQVSLDALKMVYYVIIGLAITEALSKALLDQKRDFLGRGIFIGDSLISLFLLLAFLFTIVRFVHGASIHLEMNRTSKKPWKLLWDFGGFVLHASLFYLMAVSLKKVSNFLGSFAVMVVVDAVWIVILRCNRYIKKIDFTHWQWLISDIVICAVCLILIFVGDSKIWSAIVILAIAFLG